MPLATSDFRNPICQEMRAMRSAMLMEPPPQTIFTETKTSPAQPLEISGYGRGYNEQGSMDSSDTYASCQTHPSQSQGDLTEETADTNNLYVNPLEAAEKCGNRVKKSVSGEVTRNAPDASTSVESLKDIRPISEGGKVTLNDTVPKHRKIRIQQSVRLRAQFINDQENIAARNAVKEDHLENNNYYAGLRGGRPFAATNTSLVSATRILNQHLFGSASGPKQYTGTSTESKLSLSADSIDGEGVPFIDRHRAISKSILKKSESSNNYYNTGCDSDTEKLITDNASTISMCDNDTGIGTGTGTGSGTGTETTKTKQPVSPLLSRQVLESIFRTNNNLEREDEAADQTEEKSYVSKIIRSIFDDVLEEEKHTQDETLTENKNKDDQKKPKTRGQENDECSKDSQTMLIRSLRQYKVKKSGGGSGGGGGGGGGGGVGSDEKRRSKTNNHGYNKGSDANCLPQEHRFSS